MKYKDYYKILEVKRDASQSEIQKAYRKLARKFHPDVNKDKGAEDRFKEATEAYEVLKSPENRKKYDELGANWKAGDRFTPPSGWQNIGFDFNAGPGVSGFSSFFESVFGGGMGGSGRRHSGFSQRPQPRKGADQSVEISIPLEDAYFGASRKIQLTDPSTGSSKNLQVKIPKGITSGTKIRLKGQGSSGDGSAPSGDLFLGIKFTYAPNFSSQGHNVHRVLKITPWEAALGSKIDISLPLGSVGLKIPAGIQSGSKLRLKGKGIPKKENVHGDVIVEIQISIPKELNPKEKELFEKLQNISTFNPRD